MAVAEDTYSSSSANHLHPCPTAGDGLFTTSCSSPATVSTETGSCSRSFLRWRRKWRIRRKPRIISGRSWWGTKWRLRRIFRSCTCSRPRSFSTCPISSSTDPISVSLRWRTWRWQSMKVGVIITTSMPLCLLQTLIP